MKNRIVVGLDGFVDTLLHCVDRRISPDSYRRIKTVEQCAERIEKAAGKSTNIECVLQEQTLGGNATLLARALCGLGHSIDLIATLGYPHIHPAFASLSKQQCQIHSIGEPGLTDALEFTNGKLLLGKMGELGTLSLETIFTRIKEPFVASLIKESRLIATTNWTMMPAIEQFWEWLIKHKDLISQETILFVDLADPAKRPRKDLQKALQTLSTLSQSVKVMLGLNRSECEQVHMAICRKKAPASPQEAAVSLCSKLHIHTVVIHTHYEAAASSEESEGYVHVPYYPSPKRSTGAGDTFNGGFLSAVLHDQPLQKCVEWAVGASGILVRTGNAPSQKQLQLFCSKYF